MESQFIVLAATGKEAEWLRDLLLEIPFTSKNLSAILCNGKLRHISLKHAYVRQLIQCGIIAITYVKSSENLANPFTKPLTRELVKSTFRGMGQQPFNQKVHQ